VPTWHLTRCQLTTLHSPHRPGHETTCQQWGTCPPVLARCFKARNASTHVCHTHPALLLSFNNKAITLVFPVRRGRDANKASGWWPRARVPLPVYHPFRITASRGVRPPNFELMAFGRRPNRIDASSRDCTPRESRIRRLQSQASAAPTYRAKPASQVRAYTRSPRIGSRSRPWRPRRRWQLQQSGSGTHGDGSC